MRGIESKTATQHNHPVCFGRKEPGCPRCIELTAGYPARKGWGSRRKEEEARTLAAIRAHDFKACMEKNTVCTHFDW